MSFFASLSLHHIVLRYCNLLQSPGCNYYDYKNFLNNSSPARFCYQKPPTPKRRTRGQQTVEHRRPRAYSRKFFHAYPPTPRKRHPRSARPTYYNNRRATGSPPRAYHHPLPRCGGHAPGAPAPAPQGFWDRATASETVAPRSPEPAWLLGFSGARLFVLQHQRNVDPTIKKKKGRSARRCRFAGDAQQGTRPQEAARPAAPGGTAPAARRDREIRSGIPRSRAIGFVFNWLSVFPIAEFLRKGIDNESYSC